MAIEKVARAGCPRKVALDLAVAKEEIAAIRAEGRKTHFIPLLTIPAKPTGHLGTTPDAGFDRAVLVELVAELQAMIAAQDEKLKVQAENIRRPGNRNWWPL